MTELSEVRRYFRARVPVEAGAAQSGKMHPMAPTNEKNSETEAEISPPQLAAWEFAGLLLTYWCNARCAFCYVNSGPRRRGWMSVEQTLSLWSGLDQLAAEHGRCMRIHLAGGEPFGDWPRMLSIVRAARDAGLSPLEKIETNAFWATGDGLTRARLEQLDTLGMGALVVSTDVYHQRFVPFERVRRCVEIAREVLGKSRVHVRRRGYYKNPVDPSELDHADLQKAYSDALARYKDRFTGRAAEALAQLAPRRPAESFQNQNCAKEILLSKHVHIDRYGHVFPGVCNGILLGDALQTSPSALWKRLAIEHPDRPVVSALVDGGSYLLMQRALRHGYAPLATGYAGKCHLCHHVRRFLFERGVWPTELGPEECYR